MLQIDLKKVRVIMREFCQETFIAAYLANSKKLDDEELQQLASLSPLRIIFTAFNQSHGRLSYFKLIKCPHYLNCGTLVR